MPSIWVIVIVILIIVLLGGVGGPYVNPNWQHGYGYGNRGIGIIGVILIVLVIIWLVQGGGLGRF
jgi:uncharacterized protein DUF3309